MYHLVFVNGMIFDAGLGESFFAFAAGSADAAMMLAAFVATPGLGVVEVEVLAFGGYLGFGEMGIRREQFDTVPRTEMDGVVHRFDELGAAVGVDGMVAGMVRQHDILKMVVFRNTGGYRKHDAVTEGYDGRFHVLVVVIAFGNGVCAGQEGRTEELLDERQADDLVRNTEPLAMQFGEVQFAVVMIAAVMEGERHSDPVLVLIEHGGGVKSAGENDDTIFHMRGYGLWVTGYGGSELLTQTLLF